MKNITQNHIAKVLNVTQGAISKYKNGKLRLKYDQALQLKQSFGWSDDDIKSFIKNNDNTSKKLME